MADVRNASPGEPDATAAECLTDTEAEGTLAFPEGRPTSSFDSAEQVRPLVARFNSEAANGVSLQSAESNLGRMVSKSLGEERSWSEVAAKDFAQLSINRAQFGADATLGAWRWTSDKVRSRSNSFDSRHSSLPQAPSVHVLSDSKVGGYLMRLCPDLHVWLDARVGSANGASLVMLFMLADIVRYLVSQYADASAQKVNPQSFVVVANIGSLLVAISLALFKEEKKNIWSASLMCRFFAVACMFTMSSLCGRCAVFVGMSTGAIATIGYVYMPLSALLSLLILNRQYGSLEWLSLGIMTLATMTFILLRKSGVSGSDVLSVAPTQGVALVLVSSVASALASILAEREYKRRDILEGLPAEGFWSSKFYIYKVHLDAVSALCAAVIWALPASVANEFPVIQPHEHWFGEWDWTEVVRAVAFIFQGWLAGMVTQRFSTVFRCIVDTLVSVFLVFAFDPLLGDARFESGLIPCAFLAIIVMLAAMIFQTGRLHILLLRRSVNPLRADSMAPWPSGFTGKALHFDSMKQHMTTYGSIAIFVLSDASRTLSQQQALSRSMITPQSMVLMSFVSGVVAATFITIWCGKTWKDSWESLAIAYDPRMLLRYLPGAIFFALSSAFLSMAYAHGISAALSTALGYIYMPVSAVASYFLLGKFYISVEWFGLIILTFAAAVFGYMDNYFTSSNAASQHSSVLAMVLVVASACAAVFGSVVVERVLKQEELPFHIQKIRLDMGCVLVSLTLFPIIGHISSRPQDAFWKQRPLSHDCSDKACWIVGDSGYCGSSACTCECGAGVFVAWKDALVVVALFIFVVQGWLTGVVIKQFSTVLRAIAQASTILAIYFVGDPLLNASGVHNLPLTLVAFIVPLSTTVFMVAVSESEKTMNPKARLSKQPTSNDATPNAASLTMVDQ
eukprot:TRINITY_DN40536_c0_g1_i1.p1 TRINITY_DN40536_c0_g1~~TRINITY_DN40536_c0_g1_i1.p1  ORF type:complete len:908 (+),score=117.45 TRINITY_DN40536_c0_g1_i1:121-2844(+)